MRKKYKVVEIKDDHVVVTGGKQWDDSEPLYRINKDDQSDVSLAQIGDIVSAVGMSDPRVLTEGCLESGKNVAYTRPAPLPPPKPVTWNPNDTGDSEFLSPEGFPLDIKDVDRLLRDQKRLIESLTARVRKLEVFSPVHCNVCRSHIASSGAFDQR
jgi:hypothetical protein